MQHAQLSQHEILVRKFKIQALATLTSWRIYRQAFRQINRQIDRYYGNCDDDNDDGYDTADTNQHAQVNGKKKN